ncbi:hypothetical protein FACS1894153_0630 [Bacteroidia bacterium]|nr:hypothetical protein FACS1894153_0630 [Bacteroidia bacterium]
MLKKMYSKNLFLFAIPILLCSIIYANPVTIKATAKGAENRIASLYIYADLVSEKKIKLAESIIDNNGDFSFHININETSQAFIYIDYYSTYIFLEPDENYNIIFHDYDYNLHEIFAPMRLNNYIPYKFEISDSNELNQMIWRFENFSDKFYYDHFYDIYEHKNFDTIKKYIDITKEKFDYIGHQYFVDYMKYAIAELEFNLSINTTNLFEKYINKPILYNNTSYQNFIESMFGNYFPLSVKYNYIKFTNQINNKADFNMIIDSIGRDSLLINEQFREFIFINGLKAMLNADEFSRTSIIYYLNYIINNSKFNRHKEIAKNIIDMFNTNYIDVFPENIFVDKNKKLYQFPNDTAIKSTYIFFANSTICDYCGAEIKLLNELAEYYKNINFLVVDCCYDFNSFARNFPKKNIAYKYLHFNKQFELLKTYGIVDYPMAIMLDTNHRIINSNAPIPTKNLEAYLLGKN